MMNTDILTKSCVRDNFLFYLFVIAIQYDKINVILNNDIREF